MRGVKRSDRHPPEGLEEKAQAEMQAAAAYFALSATARKTARKVDFRAYKLASVKAELERLFHGKCAYCESLYTTTAPVDVEHFRPKGAVHEAPDHDGYWWLAAEWRNLLPSCIDCNRKRRQPTPKPGADLAAMVAGSGGTAIIATGKKDSFPLADEAARASDRDGLTGEAPLLIDPSDDSPGDYLDFSFDEAVGAAIVFPRHARMLNPAGSRASPATAAEQARSLGADLRGAVSIHVYGLNRLPLVQARTRIIRRLQFLAGLIIDLDGLLRELEHLQGAGDSKARFAAKIVGLQDRILREIKAMADPSAEYSATAAAWLEAFVNDLSPAAGGG